MDAHQLRQLPGLVKAPLPQALGAQGHRHQGVIGGGIPEAAGHRRGQQSRRPRVPPELEGQYQRPRRSMVAVGGEGLAQEMVPVPRAEGAGLAGKRRAGEADYGLL